MPVWDVDQFDSLPSTMDRAHDDARSGRSAFVIVAKQQTKGRGRFGNSWSAPDGNLSCSIFLNGENDVRKNGHYSFLAAVALQKTVSPLLKPNVTFQQKWPNDALLNGQKFSGVLLEAGTDHGGMPYLILGLGVNVAAAPEDRTFIAAHTDMPVKSDDILSAFLLCLDAELTRYAQSGFAAARADWMKHAVYLNQPIHVRLGNENFDGIFRDLSPDGSLSLELADGKSRMIHSGEIFFERKPA